MCALMPPARRGDLPQLPGGKVHHRLGVQRSDVEVGGVARVDAGHRVGVGELPRREILARLVVLVVVVGDVVGRQFGTRGRHR